MFKIIGNQIFFDNWRVAEINDDISPTVRDKFEGALDKHASLHFLLKNRTLNEYCTEENSWQNTCT